MWNVGNNMSYADLQASILDINMELHKARQKECEIAGAWGEENDFINDVRDTILYLEARSKKSIEDQKQRIIDWATARENTQRLEKDLKETIENLDNCKRHQNEGL